VSEKWLKARRQEAAEEDKKEAPKKRLLIEQNEAEFRRIVTTCIPGGPLSASWKEARVLLEDEAFLKEKDEAECERLYAAIREDFLEQKQKDFRRLLDTAPVGKASPEMDFDEIHKAIIQGAGIEQRFAKVPVESLKSTWGEWRRVALDEAIQAFRDWLRRCEHFHNVDVGNCTDLEFDALMVQLSSDPRSRRLNPIPGQRRRLVQERMQELALDRPVSK